MENIKALVDGLLRRVDLIKEVTAQQQKISVLISGDGEDFLEGSEGVTAADMMALFVAQMDVSGDYELDGLAALRFHFHGFYLPKLTN